MLLPRVLCLLSHAQHLEMSTSTLSPYFFLCSLWDKMFMLSKKWISKDAIWRGASHSMRRLQRPTHFHLIFAVYLKYFPFFSLCRTISAPCDNVQNECKRFSSWEGKKKKITQKGTDSQFIDSNAFNETPTFALSLLGQKRNKRICQRKGNLQWR